jgi:hypothetical protein
MKQTIKNSSREDERKREYTFLTCPKHGIKYPKGSECPKCAMEKKN